VRKKIGKKVVDEILGKQGGKCAWCGRDIEPGQGFEVDHVVPVALGGSNEPENLQILHRPCHREKTRSDVKSIRKADRIRKKGRH